MPMVTLLDQHSVRENTRWIPKIEQLYLESFPDADEREEFLDILHRIEPSNSQIRSIICFENIGEEISGVMILDIYQNLYFHLIYLMIAPKFRGQGMCRRFLTKELQRIVESIQPTYSGVFLESNQPLDMVIDAFNPRTRLNIFRKIGVQWIPIDYIQPPLSRGKASVHHLHLLFLPSKNQVYPLTKDYISTFLKELYQSLGVVIQRNSALNAMFKELESMQRIHGSIPLLEIP